MRIKFGKIRVELPCNKSNQFSLVGLRVTDADNTVLGMVERNGNSIFIRPTKEAKARYFGNK